MEGSGLGHRLRGHGGKVMLGALRLFELWQRMWARFSNSQIVRYPKFYGKTLKNKTVTMNGETRILSEFAQATSRS